jgi:DNA gyrase subunit A
MQLRRLAALEREKIEKEYAEINKIIEELISILRNPDKIITIIKDELANLTEKLGDDRRTKIYKQKLGEFSEEDLIPKEEVIIAMTKTGYIKRLSRATFKSQRRGGKGVAGMAMKDEDEIDQIVSSSTHDSLLFFTDRGKVFGAKVWDLPESSRQSKGQAVVNLINISADEKIMSILPVGEGGKHFLMATKKGVVKKTTQAEFVNMRASGIIAIRLDADDSLVSVRETSGENDILLITKKGLGIRFPESNVRPMGRATSGVTGIKLTPGDEIISIDVFPAKEVAPEDKRKKTFRDILTISEKGMGKRTAVRLFPRQKRAGKGVKASVVTDKTGTLASAIAVTEAIDQLIITSAQGQVIKLPLKNIPELGRATQGVILMRFASKSDHVTAVATLDKPEEEI